MQDNTIFIHQVGKHIFTFMFPYPVKVLFKCKHFIPYDSLSVSLSTTTRFIMVTVMVKFVVLLVIISDVYLLDNEL